MYSFVFFVLWWALSALANPTATPVPHPAYVPQEAPVTPAEGYVPHATYGYADAYGPLPGYGGYYSGLIPAQNAQYIASLAPTVQGALRSLAKFGWYLLHFAAMVIAVGTAVCSFTSLCTITFSGFGKLDKDVVRSLVTPDKISSAAAFVQDAIGKYQRLQRAVN